MSNSQFNSSLLLAMTLLRKRAHSHGADSARVCCANYPQKDRGRRESRVLAAPAASRAEKKHTSVVATGSPKHSGLPCAMVYGLFRALLGDRAVLPPSLRRICSPQNLTPASGRQDHTALPSALGFARLAKAKASIASRPTFVTMANAPLLGETAKVLGVICPTRLGKNDGHLGALSVRFGL